MCIACSRKGGRDEFWRFKSKDGEAPVFDADNKAQGRGCSLCPSAQCVEKALSRRGFERALKLKEPLSSGFQLQLRQKKQESGL
jgi:predicted RNA-binding protein YlxR (DUF448 family)